MNRAGIRRNTPLPPKPPNHRCMLAYFSAEFGLHESLPIYSGGLGILAGDHLKSASELGLPLVGVGLLYRNGYFQQYLSADGWQQEAYPGTGLLQPGRRADELHRWLAGACAASICPDNAVFCKVWRVNVGRIPLYLLDTNLPENAPADRDITSRLYGGGTEMRIKQEIVLGIGGVRALEALGITPDRLPHERRPLRLPGPGAHPHACCKAAQLTFDEARQQVMATNVFTTHTPVPAGIDMFSPDLMVKYFRNYHPAAQARRRRLPGPGPRGCRQQEAGLFAWRVLAIRLADSINGVSWLHGDVSRQMWHNALAAGSAG